MMSKSELLQLKKCVTFIFTPHDGGFVPRGTGFFVGLPVEYKDRLPEGVHYDGGIVHPYLVTAKHVLQDTNGKYLEKIAVRINRQGGSSEIGYVVLNEDAVFTHDDPAVDIAIVPVSLDPRLYDTIVVQDELISTRQIVEQLEIGEGDDVFFIGLFTHHIGKVRNQPIVRFGRVALIPDEKVQSGPDTEEDLYLMECQSFAANSGSPAFFYISLTRHPVFMKQRLYLAGVVKGHFRFPPNEEAAIDMLDGPNMGIAAITPAFKLHDILHSSKMKEYRAEAERRSFVSVDK